ncbi:MAG: hypothetical protein EpisKO_07500 [Epibacterium sp.]
MNKMIVTAANAANLGVYRSMQGHVSGHASDEAQSLKLETHHAITGTKKASNGHGMALVLDRETSAHGKPAGPKEFEAVLEVQDAIRAGDITQLNAGSIDMSRYLAGVMSGNVEGPMPMSALLARENYEHSLKVLSKAA